MNDEESPPVANICNKSRTRERRTTEPPDDESHQYRAALESSIKISNQDQALNTRIVTMTRESVVASSENRGCVKSVGSDEDVSGNRHDDGEFASYLSRCFSDALWSSGTDFDENESPSSPTPQDDLKSSLQESTLLEILNATESVVPDGILADKKTSLANRLSQNLSRSPEVASDNESHTRLLPPLLSRSQTPRCVDRVLDRKSMTATGESPATSPEAYEHIESILTGRAILTHMFELEEINAHLLHNRVPPPDPDSIGSSEDENEFLAREHSSDGVGFPMDPHLSKENEPRVKILDQDRVFNPMIATAARGPLAASCRVGKCLEDVTSSGRPLMQALGVDEIGSHNFPCAGGVSFHLRANLDGCEHHPSSVAPPSLSHDACVPPEPHADLSPEVLDSYYEPIPYLGSLLEAYFGRFSEDDCSTGLLLIDDGELLEQASVSSENHLYPVREVASVEEESLKNQ